jgi:hypothetical protein
MSGNTTTLETISEQHQGISRRGALGGIVASATIVACGAPNAAFGAARPSPSSNVHAYEARYALEGGSLVSGFFAVPKRKTNLDVVVLVHGAEGFGPQVQQTALDYAEKGYLAVALDLPASFGDAAGHDHAALVAAAKQTAPRFSRHARGSGRVSLTMA